MIEGNKRLCAFTCVLFVVVELFLGVYLQLAQGRAVRVSSYAAVVLACLFCVLWTSKRTSYIFTQAALACTVGADFFLVLIEERQQLPAMIFFLFAQTFYFLRLYFEDAERKRRRVHLIIRVSLVSVACLLTLLVLGNRTDAVALVSMAYYASLLVNIVFSFLQNGWRSLFTVGLVLFILCDTVVGLSCLDPYMTVPTDSFLYAVIHPGFNLAWIFYVPSQVCLSMSLLQIKRERNRIG